MTQIKKYMRLNYSIKKDFLELIMIFQFQNSAAELKRRVIINTN